jgi:hypothetical protein
MKAIPFDEEKEAPLDCGSREQVLEHIRRRSVDILPPDGALPAKRHFELLRLIRRRGQMTVRELSVCLQVSGDTVRRDLDLLARRGLLPGLMEARSQTITQFLKTRVWVSRLISCTRQKKTLPTRPPG